MKRIFSNNRIIMIAFFTVFSVAATAAFANGEKALPVELRYSCSINNKPVYKLIVAGNAEPDEFMVVVRDSNKQTLFQESIKGGKFTKSFLLNTDEIGDNIIHFEITSRKTNKTINYEINRASHLDEEMTVIEPK